VHQNCHSCQWDKQIWIRRVATSGKSEQSHQIAVVPADYELSELVQRWYCVHVKEDQTSRP